MSDRWLAIRPSPILGGWWLKQHGLGSCYGDMPIGQPPPRNPLAGGDYEFSPFPTEEAAWEYAERLARRLAANRGLQVREGVRRGWRAWIFVKGEENEQQH